MTQTRREWMTVTGSALAGLTLAGTVKEALAAACADWVKVGMCDWSLGRMDLRVFPLAKKVGLDGVEVSIGTEKNDLWLRQPAIQKKYIAASKEHGIAMPSMAMGLLNSCPLVSHPKAPGWVADTVDVAKVLGAKVVLLAFFGKGKLNYEDKQERAKLIDILKGVMPRAEKAGVVLGLENLLSADQNLAVIDAVGSKHLQVYYDVYNSAGEGYDVVKEIKQMGKDQICQVHFKEGPNKLGESGKIDWPAVAAALKGIDYRGWLILETSRGRNPVAVTKTNLNYLKGLFTA